MEFLQGTTEVERDELRVYLFRYRHAVSRDRAIAYGLLNDYEQAAKLLRRLVDEDSSPDDRDCIKDAKAFLQGHTTSRE